ncbi:uncharacterized protein [Apostichopus japonicus]|uniref:uncharacterized protein isoform X2 n=1 Tax=Stichopus japonicus TaxID=307972 RepID=UPI003AB29C97
MKAMFSTFRESCSCFSVQSSCAVIVFLLFAEATRATVYMNKHCHEYVTNSGDLIKSQDTLYYKPDYNCGIVLNADRNHDNSRILLQIDDVNIASDFDCQSSFLEVSPVMRRSSESSSSLRICNKTQTPSYIVSEGSYLSLHMVNKGTGVGRGFTGVFAVIFPTNKLLSCREPDFYHCANGFCIYHDLTCDTVNHCGDDSDEDLEYCQEDDIRWMDVKKGPISIVEIAFTLIALLIIFTVIGVVVSHCCSEFVQKRKREADSNFVTGKTLGLMRRNSITVQQPGARLPVQRSTSIDLSARNAAQEDLNYLHKISTSGSDDVFVTSSEVDTRRKLSSYREVTNKRIATNVNEIQKHTTQQPYEGLKERTRRKNSTSKTVSFTIGDENGNNEDTTDERAALLEGITEDTELETRTQTVCERSVSLSETESNEEGALSLTECDHRKQRRPLQREAHIEIYETSRQQNRGTHSLPLETEI